MTIETLEVKIQHVNSELFKGNYETAETLSRQVLETLDTLPVNQSTSAHRAESILVLAKIDIQRGAYTLGLEKAHQALALASVFALGEVEPKALNLLGSGYRMLGNYSESLDFYGKSLAYHERIGAQSGVASVWGSIAVVYQNLGSYVHALEYLEKAMAIFEELGDKFNIAKVLGNIGVVHQNLKNYEKALEYYLKTLSHYQDLGLRPGIANVLGNIGTVYFSLGRYDSALEYLYKALSLFEELGEKSQVARLTGSLGSAYFEFGDYTKALEYLLKAHGVLTELGKKDALAIVTGNIGELYASQLFEGYNSELAEEYLLRAIRLGEELGVKHNLYSFHLSLSNVYKDNGRWIDAYTHYVKYNEIKEEVMSEDAIRQAQLMEHRLKIEESERDRQVKLARFQEQEKILHNILPSQIADRMIEGEKTIADSHENVSVFFSDIVGFTKLSQRVSAEELVGMLNGIFTQFDQLARKHGLEKIKTIGDAYMAVCGAPIAVQNHAERTALFAIDVAEFMNDYQANAGDKVMIRIGLHSGSVVAGIIGENKFAYDMWGDAVNTASRMESHGEAGKIHVSEEFKQAFLLEAGPNGQSHMSPTSLHFQERGEMAIKGKGMMKTYFLQKATL